MPEAALRAVRDHVTAAVAAGLPEDRAYALLRTITSYALGSGLAELCCGQTGSATCTPDVAGLLRPGTPAELAAVATVFRGQADYEAQFELGLDLMLRAIGSSAAR